MPFGQSIVSSSSKNSQQSLFVTDLIVISKLSWKRTCNGCEYRQNYRQVHFFALFFKKLFWIFWYIIGYLYVGTISQHQVALYFDDFRHDLWEDIFKSERWSVNNHTCDTTITSLINFHELHDLGSSLDLSLESFPWE